MKILALDPGTKCGFATNCGGVSGTWDVGVRKDESAGMRVIRFRAKLNEVYAAEPFELVVYEAPRHVGVRGGDRALRIAGNLEGALQTWCEDHKVEYRVYSASEIKKHATGRGNAPKPVVFQAACAKWGDVRSDDEADALWLLDLALRDYGSVSSTNLARSA